MNKLWVNKKVLNIINDSQDLNYEVNDNEMLIINYFNKQAQNMNINISQNGNSYVVINYSCLTYDDIDININGNMLGNNNRCVINVRTLAENNHASVNVCVKAGQDTIGNEIVEDLKGINEKGSITFMPILEIDTNEVDASHYVTIGSFDENELFYLQTKGLSLASAVAMLKKSFIYNLFSDEFISMINTKKGEQ